MSYEFALLPVTQAKKTSLFSIIFSKKEAVKPSVTTGSAVASVQRKRPNGVIDYVSLFQVRSEKSSFAYYENDSKTPAFSASKDKVTVHKLDDNAIRAGLQLASATFGEIRVDGPDDVRRQVWLQGRAIGIDVAGYEPSEKDRVAADKLRQSLPDASEMAQISAAEKAINSVSAASASASVSKESLAVPEEPAVATPRQPDVLVEHGAEPYDFNEKNKMSYYATVRDASGDLKMIWGIDLERAINEANAEPGDQIQLDRLGRTKVKVTDPKTQIVREVERQSWQVEVIAKAATIARGDAITVARNTIGPDAQIYQARPAGGNSDGAIIHINDRYAVQQIGDTSAILHDITKLSGSASIGSRVNISYKNDIGTVELSDKTKTPSAELFNEQEPTEDYDYEQD